MKLSKRILALALAFLLMFGNVGTVVYAADEATSEPVTQTEAPAPVAEETPAPTAEPVPEPTAAPTAAPTAEPAAAPVPEHEEAPAGENENVDEYSSAPVPPTEAPVPATEAPVPVTEAPAPVTEVPAPATEAPVGGASASEAPGVDEYGIMPIDIDNNLEMTVEKSPEKGSYEVGDVITFTIKLTNHRNTSSMQEITVTYSGLSGIENVRFDTVGERLKWEPMTSGWHFKYGVFNFDEFGVYSGLHTGESTTITFDYVIKDSDAGKGLKLTVSAKNGWGSEVNETTNIQVKTALKVEVTGETTTNGYTGELQTADQYTVSVKNKYTDAAIDSGVVSVTVDNGYEASGTDVDTYHMSLNGHVHVHVNVKDSESYSLNAEDDVIVTNGSLTITPAEVTVKANDASKTYGDTAPEDLTATVTGMVNGESAEELIHYSLSRENGEAVGEHTITASGEAKQGNYNVTYENGTFTIKKAEPAAFKTTIDVSHIVDKESTTEYEYGTPPEPKAQVLKDGKVVEDLGEPTFEYLTDGGEKVDRLIDGKPANVGNYKVRAVWDGNDNYPTVESDWAMFEITKGLLSFAAVKPVWIGEVEGDSYTATFNTNDCTEYSPLSDVKNGLKYGDCFELGTFTITGTTAGEAYTLGINRFDKFIGVTTEKGDDFEHTGTIDTVHVYDKDNGTEVTDNYDIAGSLTLALYDAEIRQADMVYGNKIKQQVVELGEAADDQYNQHVYEKIPPQVTWFADFTHEETYYRVNADGTQTKIDGESKDVGTYVVKTTWKPNNESYIKEFSRTDIFEITKRPVKLLSGSYNDVYDGQKHSAPSVTVVSEGENSGIVEGESFVYSDYPEITNFSESPRDNTYNVAAGPNTDLNNYEITQTYGKLTINKRAATVESASAEKEYDGKALTAPEVTGTGFVGDEGVTGTATGSRTLVGFSENPFTYEANEGTNLGNYDIIKIEGMLTVTDRAEKYEITVKANSDTVTYDGGEHSVSGFESLTFVVEGNTYTVEGLTATASGTAAGEYPVVVTGEAKVLDADGHDVTDQFTVKTQDGKLTIGKRTITVWTGSANGNYTGKDLTNGKYTLTNVAGPDRGKISVTVTGAQKDVGSSENTAKIDWGGANPDNYTVVEQLGTLTVGKRPVMLFTKDQTKVYDGTALTTEEVSVGMAGFADGEGADFTRTGTQTDVGSSKSSFTFELKEGTKAENYSIGTSFGTLTVTPRVVTVTTGSAEKEYDGTALTESTAAIYNLAKDETATVTATGSRTDVGSSRNTYGITWGTAKESNYTVNKRLGTLVVKKNTNVITVTANSADREYDGTPLTDNSFTYTKDILPANFTLTATVTGSQTDFGTSANTVSNVHIVDAAGKDVTDYFTVETEDGTLNVRKRALTFTGTKQEVYSGENITATFGANDIHYTSGTLVESHTLVLNATVTGKDVDVYVTRCNSQDNPDVIQVLDGSRDVTDNYYIQGRVILEITAASFDVGALGDVVYNGAAQEQKPTVTGVGGAELVEGTDYELSYSPDTTNVGTVTVTVTGKGNYAGEAKVIYLITRRPVTVTITGNSGERTYNGQPQSISGYTVEGLIEDQMRLVGPSQGEITATGTNAGNYPVVVEGKFHVESRNYNVTVVANNGALDIAQAEITLRANDGEKQYDGTPLTAEGYQVTAGRFYGEDVDNYVITVSGSQTDVGSSNSTVRAVLKDDEPDNYEITENDGTLTVSMQAAGAYEPSVSLEDWTYGETAPVETYGVTGPGAAYGTPALTYSADGETWTAEKPVNAGNYTVKAEWAGSTNLPALEATDDFTIAKAVLTVTAEDADKVYGAADPALTYTVEGLQNGDGEDTVGEVEVTREAGEDVGEYAITATGAAELPNYTVRYIDGTFTITAASLSAGELGDVVYSGAEQAQKPTVTGANGAVLVEGTDYDLSYTDDTTNVGPVTVTVTGTGNYTGTADVTYAITARPVTLLSDSYEGIYDGQEHSAQSVADVSEGENSGIVEGESFLYSGYPAITGRGTVRNSYTVAAGENTDLANYDITENEGTLTITPAEVTVMAEDADKVYGAEDPTLRATVTGLVPGESAEEFIEYDLSREDGENVNTYTITASGETVQGNYEVHYENGTFTITPAQVTVTAENADKVYGEADPALTYTVEGLQNGDGEDTVGEVEVTREAGEDVGEYAITANGAAELSNYTVRYIDGTFTITAASLSAGELGDVVYSGAEQEQKPVVTGVNGAVLVEGTDYDLRYSDDTTNVGPVTVTVTGKGNYEGTANVTYAITARPVTLLSGSYEGVYDGQEHSAQSVADVSEDENSGIVEGESFLYSGYPTITGRGTVTNGYTVAAGENTDLANYDITENEGTLTVNPAQVTVTAEDAGKVYGEDDPELRATVTGLVNGESAEEFIHYSLSREVGEAVGSYTITATGNADQGNYQVTFVPGTFTITAAEAAAMTVDAPADVLYDGAAHRWVPTVRGSDGAVLTEGRDYTVAYDTANFTDAGSITVTVTGTGNYSGTVTRTYAITPRTVTMTSGANAWTYDGTAHRQATVRVSGNGFAAGEGASYNVTGAQTNAGSSQNSFTYQLNTNTKAANYTITQTTGVLTVTPAALTVNAPADLMYDGADHQWTPTVRGVGNALLTADRDYTVRYNTADFTDAGTITATVTGTGNYTGTVTRSYDITPRTVVLTSGSASKQYDGTAVSSASVAVTGDGFAAGEGASYNVTGHRIIEGTSRNMFSYTLNPGTDADNYDITQAYGSLTITAAPVPEDDGNTPEPTPEIVNIDEDDVPEGELPEDMVPPYSLEEEVDITEDETPLGALPFGDNECCILHFLLMVCALAVTVYYTHDRKKRQAKEYELRSELR